MRKKKYTLSIVSLGFDKLSAQIGEKPKEKRIDCETSGEPYPSAIIILEERNLSDFC